jgi:hypothetical protein
MPRPKRWITRPEAPETRSLPRPVWCGSSVCVHSSQLRSEALFGTFCPHFSCVDRSRKPGCETEPPPRLTFCDRMVLSHFPYAAMKALVRAYESKQWPNPSYRELPWAELLTADVVHSTLERHQGRACRDWIALADPKVIVPPATSTPAAAAAAAVKDDSSDTPLSLVVPVFSHRTGALNRDFKRRALIGEELHHPRLMPRVCEFTKGIARGSGAPSAVTTYSRFLRNFDAFSSQQLRDIDLDGAVIGGGAVLACLLPLPKALDELHERMETVERMVHKLPLPKELLSKVLRFSLPAEKELTELDSQLRVYYNRTCVYFV